MFPFSSKKGIFELKELLDILSFFFQTLLFLNQLDKIFFHIEFQTRTFFFPVEQHVACMSILKRISTDQLKKTRNWKE